MTLIATVALDFILLSDNFPNNLMWSDMLRLNNNAVTIYGSNGYSQTWINQVLCSVL